MIDVEFFNYLAKSKNKNLESQAKWPETKSVGIATKTNRNVAKIRGFIELIRIKLMALNRITCKLYLVIIVTSTNQLHEHL